jgi:hypothetical protein
MSPSDQKERTKLTKAFDAAYPELPDDMQIQDTVLPKSWDIEQTLNALSYSSEYIAYQVNVSDQVLFVILWSVADEVGGTYLFDNDGKLIANSQGEKKWIISDGKPVPEFEEPCD